MFAASELPSLLDPFGGSGSTLIACEKAGRQATARPRRTPSGRISFSLDPWPEHASPLSDPAYPGEFEEDDRAWILATIPGAVNRDIEFMTERQSSACISNWPGLGSSLRPGGR